MRLVASLSCRRYSGAKWVGWGSVLDLNPHTSDRPSSFLGLSTEGQQHGAVQRRAAMTYGGPGT